VNRSHAVLAVLAGALCMSFAGLFVRLTEAQGMVVWLVACFTRNASPLKFLKDFDQTDFLIGVLMAAAFCFYIFSLLNTSVASTLLILSIAPVFAALLGWLVAGRSAGNGWCRC